jgi:hypothetical protein
VNVNRHDYYEPMVLREDGTACTDWDYLADKPPVTNLMPEADLLRRAELSCLWWWHKHDG